jgi:hypothetical protein
MNNWFDFKLTTIIEYAEETYWKSIDCSKIGLSYQVD